MPSFDSLPIELVLRILSYLPVQSLRSVRLTARRWNQFFVANESTIYHHAAFLHDFVDSLGILLPEARQSRYLKFLKDVPDWYTYCKRYHLLQKNWVGQGTGATAKFYGRTPYDVHRIKVDEKHGLVITTHEFGGLTVFDMETTAILWRLSSGYVRRYAHCEYENGFLIFDRIGVSKEVWRLQTLYNDTTDGPHTPAPEEAQIAEWRIASQPQYPHAPRGHFRPWRLINTPEFGRAYRFVYPSLLVSGLRKAYVWDVRTGALLQELENVQGDSNAGDINYVELSASHVFICSSSALRVFSRETKAMILEIPSYQLAYADIRLAVKRDPAMARHGLATPGEIVKIPLELTDSTALYSASYAEFSAVHVSRSGTDLVAQLSDSRIIAIRDFMRVARGDVPLNKAALELGKTVPYRGVDEHFSIYLCFEYGRIGVITTSGVYAITLDPTRHSLLDPYLASRENAHGVPREAIDAGLSFPHVQIASLPYYQDRRQLAKVTCLQVTETKMFFVWDAMYKPDSFEFFRRVGMIDPPPVEARAAMAGAVAATAATTTVGAAAAVPAPASSAVHDQQANVGHVMQPEAVAGPSADAMVVDGGNDEAAAISDAVWDAPGIEEHQAVAGPATVTTAAATATPAGGGVNTEMVVIEYVPHDANDEDEWDEDEGDEDEDIEFDDQDLLEDADAVLPADVGVPLLQAHRREREWSKFELLGGSCGMADVR
ncbi:hypothetical protein BN946_scf184403.g10 [Trametes cinnabarina]|uniref:F-box domain-containing protein n=1 Tax=Pycnoporus cinnabarinus TaxID=5643 RepID=A0A060SRM1_PYCCI|nr:hypothetical protein BN946_scf184403.g10 [Trametes cinnabarina]